MSTFVPLLIKKLTFVPPVEVSPNNIFDLGPIDFIPLTELNYVVCIWLNEVIGQTADLSYHRKAFFKMRYSPPHKNPTLLVLSFQFKYFMMSNQNKVHV